MNVNNTKSENQKERFTGFSCCSGNLEGMREMMNKFCGGTGGVPDCSTLMQCMMKNCFESKEKNAKSNSESSNDSRSF